MIKLKLYSKKDLDYARQRYLVVFDETNPSDADLKRFVRAMRSSLYK